jgi:MFS transporter, FSR family, fosmidomycin resistance protein
VGLLFALPHVFACVLETLLGLLGDAWNRRALLRMGGVGLIAGLLLVSVGAGFGSLLGALLLVFPASGAYVGLSQAALMDAEPLRQELNMARWTLAGAIGVLAGPILLTTAGAVGLGWRATFCAMAGVGALSLALAWRLPMPQTERANDALMPALLDAGREALGSLRRGEVLRWLTLLQLADLMLDVLHGFVALYFVDVTGATPAQAVVAVLVYTAVGLLGDVLMIPLLKRSDGLGYLHVSACAVLVAFPLFLLLEGSGSKLVLLGVVALLTAGWYAVLKARLYSAMPGRSATVMALDSLSGVVGGLMPLLVGVAAQIYGLGIAMWLLTVAPLALLAGVSRRHG